MTKHFYLFGNDVGQWAASPSLTGATNPLQKRYLNLKSCPIGAMPVMPPAGSGRYLVDQMCGNTDECQRIISETLEKNGACYVRIFGNPTQPRLIIWEALP